MDREEFTASSLSGHLNANYVNLNWDQPPQFESALSSIVSSPTNQTPQSDNVVIRELIGRLGTICNSSGEMSPHSQGYNNNSANASSYTTPLNSPPKLGLSMSEHHYRSLGSIPISGNPMKIAATGTAHLGGIVADPGFAERAARFSCFGGRSYVGFPGVYPQPEAASQLLQVNENISPKSGCGSQLNDRDAGGVREEPSVSDHIPVIGRSNARKRKSISRPKPNETAKKLAGDDSNAKNSRFSESKLEQASGVESGDGSQEQSKDSNSKTPELPKLDYIHVRARRGQATDSHSLAERVRREKISERMKFLQDLVPGCNKVTGKAVMLDEIINYVQSLQRQVEFLSMKLSTVNPRLDLNIENLMSKDMHGSLPHSGFPMDISGPVFPFSQNIMMNGVQSHCSLNPSDAASLFGTLWEDDLQSVVQMGYGQNHETAFSAQPFPGALPSTHMKVEL